MEEIRNNPLRSKESGQDIPIGVFKLECAWERMGGLGKHSQPQGALCVVLRPHWGSPAWPLSAGILR